MSGTKRCKGCLQEKEVNAFAKHATSPEGRIGFCKICMTDKTIVLCRKERVEDQTIEKVCKSCNLSKPLLEYAVARKNKDGYVAHCRTCAKQKWKKDGSIVKAKNEALENNTKCCKGCNITKILNEFNKDPKGFGGYKSKCKACLQQQKICIQEKNVQTMIHIVY